MPPSRSLHALQMRLRPLSFFFFKFFLPFFPRTPPCVLPTAGPTIIVFIIIMYAVFTPPMAFSTVSHADRIRGCTDSVVVVFDLLDPGYKPCGRLLIFRLLANRPRRRPLSIFSRTRRSRYWLLPRWLLVVKSLIVRTAHVIELSRVGRSIFCRSFGKTIIVIVFSCTRIPSRVFDARRNGVRCSRAFPLFGETVQRRVAGQHFGGTRQKQGITFDFSTLYTVIFSINENVA